MILAGKYEKKMFSMLIPCAQGKSEDKSEIMENALKERLQQRKVLEMQSINPLQRM